MSFNWSEIWQHMGAPAMTIAPDWPTLAMLTMLVPAGVAAAWALNSLGHRRGAG